VREIAGQRLRLKYYPFPLREKAEKEYLIGEALLRWKGMPEDEVVGLKNVASDPPDLVFERDDLGEIRIEITELVPYDRASEVRSANFVRILRADLEELGTRPLKPSNIFVSREPFGFPPMSANEIKRIAEQIDTFFNTKDFEAKYEIVQEVVTSPIRIAFIPALGTFGQPPEHYDNNLLVQDITGYPLDEKEYEHSLEAIIVSKRHSKAAADILVIFQGTIGIVGLGEDLQSQAKNRLRSDLAYQGIYIAEIVQLPHDYWVHVITVREHPLFERR